MKSIIKYLVLLTLAYPIIAYADTTRNGFELSNASVPVDLILHGGPPKDGIPAIDNPIYIEPAEATWLKKDDLILGVFYNDIARAYPIKILNWHEIVNDKFNDTAILVSFCPLCGTGIVFKLDEEISDYGVSGLLYNSDVLLYDRQTESLWSQILGVAVAGDRVGEELTAIPSLHTTWEHWYELHPETKVLSRDTGSLRDYDQNPYVGYKKTTKMIFPVANTSSLDIHPKERILGVKIGGVTKAYPFSKLLNNSKSEFTDIVAKQKLTIHVNHKAPVAWVSDEDGNTLSTTDGFWFAWYAFYPDTLVWE